jgi:hypothetical protein
VSVHPEVAKAEQEAKGLLDRLWRESGSPDADGPLQPYAWKLEQELLERFRVNVGLLVENAELRRRLQA